MRTHIAPHILTVIAPVVMIMMDDRNPGRRDKEEASDRSQFEAAEPIRMAIDPGSASSAEIGELFTAMSDLNRACRGLGLTFTVTDQTEAGVPIVEARPNTLGPIDQPPHSFKKGEAL